MSLVSILPVLAGILYILFMVFIIYKDQTSQKWSWIFPALLSLLFLFFTLLAVFSEGPTGFWTEHIRNMWGNQIWFDLLLAAGIGWLLIVPQAKALNMRLPLWLVLIVSTGCIGFLAMVARMLYLREHHGK